MTCDGETVYKWPESRAAVQTTEEKESAAAGLKTEEKGEGRQPAVTGSRGGLASRTEMAADGCSDGRATAPQIWTGSGAVLLRGGAADGRRKWKERIGG